MRFTATVRTAKPWTLGGCCIASRHSGHRAAALHDQPSRDVDDSLIAAHRDIPALMPFVHLPVQSGSDRILAAMNRKHTAADYHRTDRAVPRARDDMAFSSDFIVGFPGETDEDFAATLALSAQIGYAGGLFVQVFAAAGNSGRGHARDDRHLDHDGRAARAAAAAHRQPAGGLQCRLHRPDARRAVRAPGRREGQIVGRSAYLQPVHVMASQDIIGQVRPVRITGLERYSLFGELPAAQAGIAARR
jgi:tRNA-2-methylthio-N6-dimethylallyladenosine synthase